jgi:hypothetical protein
VCCFNSVAEYLVSRRAWPSRIDHRHCGIPMPNPPLCNISSHLILYHPIPSHPIQYARCPPPRTAAPILRTNNPFQIPHLMSPVAPASRNRTGPGRSLPPSDLGRMQPPPSALSSRGRRVFAYLRAKGMDRSLSCTCI